MRESCTVRTMRAVQLHMLLILGIVLLATTVVSGQSISGSSSSSQSQRGFPGIKPRGMQCKTDTDQTLVKRFLKAQTGFPSNLRQFFPPTFDLSGTATDPVMEDQIPPNLFALADFHGALDTWVQEQIDAACMNTGQQDNSACMKVKNRFKDWKKYDASGSTVEVCKTRGFKSRQREEIRVNIKAKNVFVFAQTVDALIDTGFDFLGTDTVFGDKLTSKTPIDSSKWVFGESEFQWTFEKGVDIDLGLVNYFLRQGEPPPNADPNAWIPLNLTPYTVSLSVKAKSGDRCLIIKVEQSDKDYLGTDEDDNSFDTPKIIPC